MKQFTWQRHTYNGGVTNERGALLLVDEEYSGYLHIPTLEKGSLKQ